MCSKMRWGPVCLKFIFLCVNINECVCFVQVSCCLLSVIWPLQRGRVTLAERTVVLTSARYATYTTTAWFIIYKLHLWHYYYYYYYVNTVFFKPITLYISTHSSAAESNLNQSVSDYGLHCVQIGCCIFTACASFDSQDIVCITVCFIQ